MHNNIQWSESDINLLNDRYHNTKIKELSIILNRSELSIKKKASLLKLVKDNPKNKKSNLEVLLDESLTSYYWIGFLLADGSFSPTNSIKLGLSIVDKEHLEKFASYISSTVKTYTCTSGYSKDIPHVEVRAMDKNVVPILVHNFNILPNKTYNPPTFSEYDIDDNRFISLIIGFIDGDGCISSIRKNGKYRIRIQSHSSWIDNLSIINRKLHDFCNTPISNKISLDGRGYACLSIGKYEIFVKMQEFIIKYSLPVLDRKWFQMESN